MVACLMLPGWVRLTGVLIFGELEAQGVAETLGVVKCLKFCAATATQNSGSKPNPEELGPTKMDVCFVVWWDI